MGGKRRVSRLGARLAVVLALTVLGNVAVSGIAAAAPRACTGRATESCVDQTDHFRSTETAGGDTDTVAPVADSPAVVSAPVVSQASVEAPSAPKPSAVTTTATRADHEGHDSEPDAETGVDPDCDEDDVDDAPEADDDEDCTTGGTPDPEPCDDDADDDDEGDDDEGEEADEDDCVAPEPPAIEICGDGIDNDKDGKVDEDCEGPDTPEPPAPPAPPVPPQGPIVLPRQVDRLPATGADVTSLFLIGLTLVAIGGATRIRTSPVRVVFAGQGSVAELILVQYLNHVATQRTIRRRRT